MIAPRTDAWLFFFFLSEMDGIDVDCSDMSECISYSTYAFSGLQEKELLLEGDVGLYWYVNSGIMGGSGSIGLNE